MTPITKEMKPIIMTALAMQNIASMRYSEQLLTTITSLEDLHAHYPQFTLTREVRLEIENLELRKDKKRIDWLEQACGYELKPIEIANCDKKFYVLELCIDGEKHTYVLDSLRMAIDIAQKAFE